MFFAEIVTTDVKTTEATGLVDKFIGIGEKLGIDWAGLGWQMLGFAILAFVIWKFGFKPLMKTVEDRQKKIEEGLKFSDEMKSRLSRSEEECRMALEKSAKDSSVILESARKTAQEIVDKAALDATQRVSEIEKRSSENIERERIKMLSELKDEVATLVVEITKKVLARDISGEEKEKIATRSLEEIRQQK